VITLDDLVSRKAGERVLGSYLYPIRAIGGTPSTALDATRVLTRVEVGAEVIFLTRCGGLFIVPPASFRDAYREGAGNETFQPGEVDKKAAYANHVADLFNLVVCELALRGFVYEPISPLYVLYGRMADDYATVVVGGGSGHVNMERQFGPLLALLERRWNLWSHAPDTLVRDLGDAPIAKALSQISAAIPSLVAGAYSHFANRQFAEAIADSWIVSEQFLDEQWERFSDEASPERRSRLADRSFTANVRAELLFSAGRIPKELYEAVQSARTQRNKLMHAASVSYDAALACMRAMKLWTENRLAIKVADGQVSSAVLW
jgi:hypothetical protein